MENTKQNQLSLEEFLSILPAQHDTTKLLYGVDEWATVANGYKAAGDMLADEVVAALPKDSSLIFPMLFCYRHYIELSLKDLLRGARAISGNRLSKNDFVHKLEQLLERFNAAVPADFDFSSWTLRIDGDNASNAENHFSIFCLWCDRFAKADPDSFRFRYPYAKKEKFKQPYPDISKELGVKDVSSLKSGIAEFREAVSEIGLIVAILNDLENMP